MTKLMDVGKVLRGYYGTHKAVRDDLDILQAYAALSSDERKRLRSEFERWFLHHKQMMIEHNRAEDEYYFPHMSSLLKDHDDFVRYMLDETKDVLKRSGDIDTALKSTNDDDAVLLQAVQRYIQAAEKRLNDEEAIYVRHVIEHYTQESYEKLGQGYIKTLSLARLAVLLPWQLTKLNAFELQTGKTVFPAFLRFILNNWWIPAYLRKYPRPSWKKSEAPLRPRI